MINSHVGTGRNSTGSINFDFAYILHHNFHPKGGHMGDQINIYALSESLA